MMVSVNLFMEKDAPVKAQVLGGPGSESGVRFIVLDIGGLSVILADAKQAERIARALFTAVDELEAKNGTQG